MPPTGRQTAILPALANFFEGQFALAGFRTERLAVEFQRSAEKEVLETRVSFSDVVK